jgi:hypothetical protein
MIAVDPAKDVKKQPTRPSRPTMLPYSYLRSGSSSQELVFQFELTSFKLSYFGVV